MNVELNEVTGTVTQWYKDNTLNGNKGKLKIMTLPGRMEKVRTTINGHEILPSNELRLLGLENTINSALVLIFKKIGFFSRLKNLIPFNTKLHIYKAAILPNLTYCHSPFLSLRDMRSHAHTSAHASSF